MNGFSDSNQATRCSSDLEQKYSLFQDKRSKRVIFVSHCLLNQNAMIDGLACYPGVFREAVDAMLASGCGIVQLECPEMRVLGLDRKVDINDPRTTGSEDTRVRILMEKRSGRSCCRKMADKVVYQIEQYLRSGFVVAGVLGINASPTCGVETSWSDGTEVPGAGVFIQELQKSLVRHNLKVPVCGINLNDPEQATNAVRQISGGQ
jgi:predicted secreted protein